MLLLELRVVGDDLLPDLARRCQDCSVKYEATNLVEMVPPMPATRCTALSFKDLTAKTIDSSFAMLLPLLLSLGSLRVWLNPWLLRPLHGHLFAILRFANCALPRAERKVLATMR